MGEEAGYRYRDVLHSPDDCYSLNTHKSGVFPSLLGSESQGEDSQNSLVPSVCVCVHACGGGGFLCRPLREHNSASSVL